MATLLFELCVGFRRFSDDIAMMIGHRPNYYWLVCWVALTPAMTWVIYFAFVNTSFVSFRFAFLFAIDCAGYFFVTPHHLTKLHQCGS